MKYTYIIGTAIVLAVLGFLGVYMYLSALQASFQQGAPQTGVVSADGTMLNADEAARDSRIGKNILNSIRGGDYAQTESYVESALAEGSETYYSEETMFRARQNTIASYRLTNDLEDAKRSIQELKNNFLNEDLSLEMRIISLNSLATVYCGYGRDPRVLAEVFKDEPFAQHWVEGNPGMSGMNLLMWSYELMPTPRAAISIAHMMGARLLLEDLSESERAEVVAMTEQYLREAGALANTLLANNDDAWYGKTRRYVAYLYWRAFTVMALEQSGVAGYAGEGQKAYETFFTVAVSQENVNSAQYIPFAHVVLAKFAELRGADTAEIHAHLDEALRLVAADTQPQANELIDFIGDVTPHLTGGFVVVAIRDMAQYYKPFGDFVAVHSTQ